jgi:transcriptional antiterminator RfaH
MRTNLNLFAAAPDQTAGWYLVQCKSRQDERAQEHLVRQGYRCYRPQHSYQRIERGRL